MRSSQRRPRRDDTPAVEIVGPDAVLCAAGHVNAPDAEFCVTCGVSLDPANPQQQQQQYNPVDFSRLPGQADITAAVFPALFRSKVSQNGPEIVGADAIYCPRHHPNVADATVCSVCGLALPTSG